MRIIEYPLCIYPFASMLPVFAYAGQGLLEAHEDNTKIAQATKIVIKVFIISNYLSQICVNTK